MYFADFSKGYVLSLEPEEELHTALIRFSIEKRIPSAFYQGIGSLKSVEIGIIDLEKKTHRSESFEGPFELLQAMGNLSLVDGISFPHTHVTLVSNKGKIIGGHLIKGITLISLEIIFTPIDIGLLRKVDQKSSYKKLDLPHHFT